MSLRNLEPVLKAVKRIPKYSYEVYDFVKIVFGPVPSRRLGISLGINNVYYKYCTYSCIYCQAGRTTNLTILRREFHNPKEVLEEVKRVLENREVDYITFVPNGEPTLDLRIGEEIELLKEELDVRVAVITNGSLLWMNEVRKDLMQADLVSLKIDSINQTIWRRINNPHPKLNINKILEGMLIFSKEFNGTLITETMLVKGVNDTIENAKGISLFLSKINPNKAYIMIPVRPPAENWVTAPPLEKVVMFHEVFKEVLGEGGVEMLITLEPPSFKISGNVIENLLNMVSIHPLKIDYLEKILKDNNLNPEVTLKRLLNENKIEIVEYEGTKFVIRKH